jgi:DNA end-binding protein Ku
MARALWSGAIAFGLVNIPVKLFGTAETKDLSFTTLHAECKTPLRRPYVCPTHDNAPVESKDMVKGYEFSKGQFVLVTEQDLENVPIETGKAIEVSGFVDAADISPLLRERNYYLAPVELSVKPFELFRQALLRTGKVALARAILWKKEQLVAISPQDGGIVLTTLLYQDELKPPPDIPATAPVVVTEDEIALALQLITALTTEFDLSQFKDRYREALVQLIQAKVEGKEIPVVTRPEGKPTQDLMAALKASLAAAKAS